MSETTRRAAADGALPTEEIRSHFPALERIHGGRRVAYFDGPGGTQVPRAVVEAMTDYLFRHNANTHWSYPTSAETDELIERSREVLSDFLNAWPEEIIFGANATTLAFHLSRTLGRTFAEGDEIVVTELDHHANVAPWRALERERGVVVRAARMNPEEGRLTGTISRARSTRGRGSSPSARRRTRSGRSRTWPARRAWRARPGPTSSLTQSTTRRTNSWT
jgi:selenocysteine lyase/cysteine desulfurase